MMVFSTYKKQRIIFLYQSRFRPPEIVKILKEDHLIASRQGVAKFIKHYRQTCTISRKHGSGRPSVITAQIKAIVDHQMTIDDETSAHQLYALLRSRGFSLSLRTILRCRTALGWTFRGSAYCQLIRQANKVCENCLQ